MIGDIEPTAGKVSIGGQERKVKNPYQARHAGILSVPKERRDEGMIGILSIENNIVISHMEALQNGVILSGKKTEGIANEWVRKAGGKCVGIKQHINKLSGGNAQKVIFARALESACPVLILNHPTRGVDVGSKEEIYTLIREMTEAGNSIIVIGDTLDECIGLSSRIIVLKDGLVTAEFDCPVGNKPTQMDIVQTMM